MRDLLKFIGCLLCLCFCVLEEIRASNQKDLDKGGMPEEGAMFSAFPVLRAPGLYLLSEGKFRYFNLPEGKSITEIAAILTNQGFVEATYPRSPLTFEVGFCDKGRREKMTNDPTADILPQAVKSAIDLFLTDCRSGIPEDEKVLFFLRSLFLLKNPSDTKLMDSITDKLSNYDSYYELDPYEASSERLHDIGVLEYKKFFTEQCLKDLVLVLEFSKLMKGQNEECARDFEVFSDVLKVIVETFVENESNSVLLRKFKELYERVVRG